MNLEPSLQKLIRAIETHSTSTSASTTQDAAHPKPTRNLSIVNLAERKSNQAPTPQKEWNPT